MEIIELTVMRPWECALYLPDPSFPACDTKRGWLSLGPRLGARVQLVFPSGLGIRSGYSWCSRVAGYEVRVQLVFSSGLGMRQGTVGVHGVAVTVHPQLLLLFPPGEVHVPRGRSSPSWQRMGELLPLTLKVGLQNLVLFV